MDNKHPNENRSCPTISGDPSTDRAIWGLSLVLWEIACDSVARTKAVTMGSSEKHTHVENQPQALDSIVEQNRLVLKPMEVAAALGVSRRTIYEMLATGEIPSIRIGRNIRISRKALENWIANRQLC